MLNSMSWPADVLTCWRADVLTCWPADLLTYCSRVSWFV
jgi:hypothetical protein